MASGIAGGPIIQQMNRWSKFLKNLWCCVGGASIHHEDSGWSSNQAYSRHWFIRPVDLRWLEKVSSTHILMGRYNHSLSLDATIMVSKNCPTIGEHVVTIFVTQ